jgi:palmitoyltransferase ZDHHC3/7/25
MGVGLGLVLLTYVILCFIYGVVRYSYRVIDSESVLGLGIWVLYSVSAGMTALSHLISHFLRPSQVPNVPGAEICKKCLKEKPYQTHHCSKCNTCVYKMDHHCYWINNCVGRNNQKEYILFLCYVAIFTGLSGIAVVGNKVYCNFDRENKECMEQENYVGMDYAKMIALVLSMFFFSFVAYLLSEQYDAITSNLSQIDKMKGVIHNENHEFWDNFQQVFKSKPSLCWMIPGVTSLNPFKLTQKSN